MAGSTQAINIVLDGPPDLTAGSGRVVEVENDDGHSIAIGTWTQRAGNDPTYAWRKLLQDEYGKQYGVEPPAHVAAMFVLMWYVGVPALVAGMSTALTGVSPDVSPESLAFRRHPTAHFPAEVVLLSDRVVPLAE